ncbi:hypothetical protein K1719_008629 [Acacia pycnantha]|nr:hypothetical protein K1719_008629 [Acacia pycnantha]
MDCVVGEGSKPHAVLIPFPVQGHINPMLNLAKLLHLQGFFITFVNTEFNHKRLLRSRGVEILHGLPDFQFETIPDGLPPPANDNATQDLPSLCDSTRKNCLLPFQNLLARLSESASNGLIPPLTCLVSAAAMFFTIDAAQALGLPILLLWPASTYSLLALVQYKIQLGKDESNLTKTTDPKDRLVHFLFEITEKAHKASAICFNTFDELEGEAVKALSSIYSIPLYTIGPFPSFLCQIQQTNQLLSFKSSLWKEESQCLDWLQLKEPKSVVYVNFGSIAIVTPEQLYEFAWGLANSKKPFLWIIRPDLVNGGSVILSPEFITEIKDRGLIASWCEQEKILNHPAIGGFLTHCGWNSMTESICAGVPMICRPFDSDQHINCMNACKNWEIGVEIANDVKREEVEKLVNELMEGEKGRKMRQKALEWKKMAEEDTRPGGSSYINLENMIKDVLIKTRS